MRFSGVSANAIWNNAIRTITGLGGGFNTAQGVNQTVAANSTFSFAPIAGIANVHTFAAIADASGTVVIQHTDGTNTWTVTTIAAGATGGQDNAYSVATVFWQIHNNSATVAAKYWYSGYSLIK